MIAITLLLLLLAGSMLVNFFLGAGLLVGSAFQGHDVTQATLQSGQADQEIAVIPLDGIITDSTRERFDRLMQRADQDKNLKALVIDIDSPGGEVTPSDEIYERIERFKRDHPNVPVAASMRSMAASGAYYAACAAQHLVAENTTVTGSIGVLWPRYNIYDLMKKWGVKDTTIVSEGAPFKDAGSMTMPQDEQQEHYLQGLVDGAFTRFKAVVAQSRKGKLTPDISEVANGKAYLASQALQNGLIDEIGYLDAAVKWAATSAGLSKPQVIRYSERASFIDRFPFAQEQSGAQGQGLTINGVQFNIDREALDSLRSPRLLYLWRGN